MKRSRTILFLTSLFVVLSMLLSACAATAPAASPTAAVAAASGGTLTITGLVAQKLSLADADLKAMNITIMTADQPKAGSQTFKGVRLSDLFTKAQVKAEAANVVFTASDGFTAQLDLATVKSCADCMVAFTDTPGAYLLVMPGQAGKLWVKNLNRIEIK